MSSSTVLSQGGMYNWRVRSVCNALEQRGKAHGPLDISDLTALGHLDQYHYLGTEACDQVLQLLGLDERSTVLDIGSGIGGPARYLAAKSGCHVTAVELQPDLSQAAEELTSRVAGLEGKVRFLTGDFVTADLGLPPASHQHFISLLVFLHIADRTALLKRCHDQLSPGGSFVIEDFIERAPFTAAESTTLRDLVKAPTVTTASQYLEDLRCAGFVDLELVDLSDEWTLWTEARHQLFLAAELETVRMHGRSLFEERMTFYAAIETLFARGNLGGVRISGRRPSTAEASLTLGRQALRHPKGEARAVQVVEGSGNTHTPTALDGVLPSAVRLRGGGGEGNVLERRAQSLHQSSQPPFPASDSTPFHDSLQYHFFFPGFFLAARVFHTASLQHHSAWLALLDGDAPPQACELHNSSDPLVSPPTASGLHLSGDEMELVDTADGGSLHLRPSSADAIALLRAAGVADGPLGRPELSINISQRRVLGWLPASQEAAGNVVLHRPDLHAAVEWQGATRHGHGYSKRYYGDYPRHWGYRFIHGVGAPGPAASGGARTPSPGEPAVVLWTADATFGEHKYNYYKLMPDAASETPLIEAPTEATWQQGDAAYALIDGVQHRVELKPLCRWATVITDGGRHSDSHMENRLCEMVLKRGDAPYVVGLAYNERCYGTVG